MGLTDHWHWASGDLNTTVLSYETEIIGLIASNPEGTVHRIKARGAQGVGTDETMTGSLAEAKASLYQTLVDLGWAMEKDPIRGGQIQ